MTRFEQAQRYLADRGILAETAGNFRVETVNQPTQDQLQGWLGCNGYVLEAAIVFPNLTCNDDDCSLSVHSYYVRCFPPPIGQDGKERKFLSTLGSTYRPYVLPPVLDVAYDIGQPIYIVEKQTAALLLWQTGLPVVALDGTWGAAAKRAEGEAVKLHPILAEFDWTGRPVHLCFDSDFRSRVSVLQGLIRTYLLFSTAGAVVRVIQWDPQFKGLDDLIAASARLDVSKQRAEIETLTATVAGLSAAKVSENWIIPQYRSLFEREIAAIAPGRAERSMLAECIHEALGTTASDLKKSWGIATKPAAPKKDDGTTPIPEVWPDPIVYSEVADDLLSEFLDPHFVVVTEAQGIVCAVHTITTYLTDYIEDWLHFLYVTAGAKASGKTKLLQLFFELSYRADLSGNPSAASVYYALQEGTYTILIDEVDKNEQRREAVLDLINYSSSRATAWVSRVDLEKGFRKKYCTFCPKILAGNGSIRDTAASRCIKIQMMRKGPGGPRVMIKKADRMRFGIMRSKLMRLASEIGPKIQDYDIDLLKLPGGLYNREADNWILLFLTAEMIGGHWPTLLHAAYKELCPPRDSDSADDFDSTELGEPIIRDIARIWMETPDQEFYATDTLRQKLNSLKERPWPGLRKGMGISLEKIGSLLRAFGKKSVQHRVGEGARCRGFFLVDLDPLFESYARDIWNPPDPSQDGGGNPPDPEPPKSPSTGANKEKGSDTESGPVPPVPSPADQVFERVGGVAQVFEQSGMDEFCSNLCHPVSSSKSTHERAVAQVAQVETLNSGVSSISLPPSTPQAPFLTTINPECLLFLDIETFYPWDGSYSQPAETIPGSLLRRRNKGLAHPWAKDPRRCALRFLTVHDTEGGFGAQPLTIDLHANPELPGSIREALANRTLVGHNLDFDLTVLRRYGIPVSSSVLDTMLASRLLGLGKEKFKVRSDIAYCDLNCEELEELVSLEDPNPVDHDLATVVRRYLGNRMEKARTKLGGSDWSHTDLSPAHYVYMTEDVGYLPALWTAIEQALREAQLDTPFRERMKFFPHLNQIKMAGIPIEVGQRDADCQRVTVEKATVREELQAMFSDYHHPIPKSRLKTIKIKAENGRFQRVPGPTHEEFSPSNRDHVLGALTQRGIVVENTQEATLKKLDAPECCLLLKYTAVKKRLEVIKGITRSSFCDGRVRAAGWNQLSARTGRITSTEPNLQQVPRDWRTGFRVEPPKLWLKGDLSQIEMVIIAIVTGDRNLIELLRSGRDVYVEYGARIFGKKAERGSGDDQITDRLRSVAKVPTLGISYGLTPFGFVRQVQNELGINYEIQEAQGFFETFFEMFPQIAAYQARAAEDALSLDRVCTIGGTRRWLPPLVEDRDGDYWPSFERRKKILINTPIQGSGADLVIWAVNRFMHELPEGVEIVNLVHDEVDAIVTRETLKATLDVITRAFQETFAGFYPSSELVPKIKFSCGPSWGETVSIDGTGA